MLIPDLYKGKIGVDAEEASHVRPWGHTRAHNACYRLTGGAAWHLGAWNTWFGSAGGVGIAPSIPRASILPCLPRACAQWRIPSLRGPPPDCAGPEGRLLSCRAPTSLPRPS